MSDIIEVVARSMAEAEGWRWDDDRHMLDRSAAGLQHSARERDTWRQRARTALTALGRPSDNMKVAGGLKCEALMFEGGSTGIIFHDMGTVFTTMIDAALGEAEAGR